jgi:hypothetical protein
MLKAEIEADVGITTSLRTGANGGWLVSNADVLDVWFSAAISGAEETALDAVLTAHTGTTTSQSFQFWESNTAVTTVLETFDEKMSRTAAALVAGTYKLSWYFEMKVTVSGPLNSNGLAQFLVDANVKGSCQHRSVEWSSFSGWDRYVAAEGDTPVLSIEIRRDPTEGGNDTIEIRKMKLGVELMDT